MFHDTEPHPTRPARDAALSMVYGRFAMWFIPRMMRLLDRSGSEGERAILDALASTPLSQRMRDARFTHVGAYTERLPGGRMHPMRTREHVVVEYIGPGGTTRSELTMPEFPGVYDLDRRETGPCNYSFKTSFEDGYWLMTWSHRRDDDESMLEEGRIEHQYGVTGSFADDFARHEARVAELEAEGRRPVRVSSFEECRAQIMRYYQRDLPLKSALVLMSEYERRAVESAGVLMVMLLAWWIGSML